MGLLDSLNKLSDLAYTLSGKEPDTRGMTLVEKLETQIASEKRKVGPWRSQYKIDELEKQLVAAKQKAIENVANQKAEREEWLKTLKNLGLEERHTIGSRLNLTDLSKLDFLKATPRNIEDPQVAAAIGEAPKLGKDKWKEKMANAKLAYLYVVETNYRLLHPGKEALPAVFLMAKEENLLTDKDFLYKVGDNLGDMREGRITMEKEYFKFFKMLNDEQSHLWFDIKGSLTDGHDVTCFSDSLVEAKFLPNGFIPTDRIIPVLVSKIDTLPTYKLIPGDLYKKA